MAQHGKLGLDVMLDFYPVITPDLILDATYNAGRFWKGSVRPVVSMDIDPRYKPDIIADDREMPGVEDDSYAVVVYDPPHVGPQGRDKSTKRFDVDFSGAVIPAIGRPPIHGKISRFSWLDTR